MLPPWERRRHACELPAIRASPTGVTVMRFFPPLKAATIDPQDEKQPSARRLASPVIDPAALPIRPERHVPNSIATVRRRLTTALARSLTRCPYCLRRATHRSTNLVTQ